MNDLSVVVKDVLESTDLKNINKVDLKNISKDALIGAINCLPVVGGVIASYFQIAKTIERHIWKWISIENFLLLFMA